MVSEIFRMIIIVLQGIAAVKLVLNDPCILRPAYVKFEATCPGEEVRPKPPDTFV